ncbi:GNAT family N-acetyltransferase [Bacillaceae bacterium Marseille-Q3522]|nr:GNAT family N-acetyltransferase [Bacillaceae bacterium Marseille-Q3522]
MHWYEKLKDYFPKEEMKSQDHMEALLKDFPDVYHKDEGEHHVMVYVEFETFVFIDYLFVSRQSRGKGLGHQLIQKLKAKGKPIILEVEPLDYKESDTEKRLRFYKREGFKHARSIGYRRRSLSTKQITPMEILYWSPSHGSEAMIYDAIKKTYIDIHTYKDVHLYGEAYEHVDEVVTFHHENNKKNMLEEI